MTEPILWIQLVAEGSLSNQRALGVATTSARHVNVEGSTIGLRRAKGLVKSKESFSIFEGEVQHNRRRAPAQSKKKHHQMGKRPIIVVENLK